MASIAYIPNRKSPTDSRGVQLSKSHDRK